MFPGQRLPAICLGVVAALIAVGAAAETGILERDTALGKVLTDAQGMTLYTFDKDSNGQSACYDACARNWPPLIAPDGAKAEDDFGLTQRADGQVQWTYYGKPLYLWVQDKAPGDTNGDGLKGVWHVANPK